MGPHMAAQFLFLSVVVTAALSFVAVMVWLGHRKKEREAFYRTEVMKKIAESGTAGPALEFVRETERLAADRARAALQLTGLIIMAAGVGLMVFAYGIEKNEPMYLVGLIPTLVGMVIFGFALVPRRID